MAYIGNTVQNQGFTPAIDYFSGNGVTVTFTLSRPVASVAQLIVAIDNVIQNPSTAFSVSGNSITFTSAPLSGTNNIWVEYTSLITTYAAISQDPSVIGDISATGGYLAEGDFGNTFIDGTIVDYVTGTARITTGPADAIAFYNGGTNARNTLLTLGADGNATFTGTVTATAFVGVFPAGTKLLFQQTAAPTGWTKDTTHDNKALRVVSGAASSGGSVAFTTAFASQAVSGTVGSTTLSLAQIPGHTHDVRGVTTGDTIGISFGGNTGGFVNLLPAASFINQNSYTGALFAANAGSTGSHNHSFTGTAINLAVQYVDVIIATKD